MDWDALHVGLKAWFSMLSGIAPSDIAWDGEPVGHRGFPQADLKFGKEAPDRGTDELRREADAQGRLTTHVVGNRVVPFTITVTTRDQRGSHRAYAVLSRVRTKMGAPFTEDTFAQLEVAQRESAALEHVDEVVDSREMSVAALTIQLGFTVIESDDLAGAAEPIEHVIVSGTVEPVGEVPEKIVP